jgi:L-seryl-tRNA(Ser) seleniumtransferase
MKHPLARALRVDKLTIASLAATLDLYLTQRIDRVPVWEMLGASPESIRRRASAWQSRLRELDVEVELADSQSTVGGGSLPGEQLATTVIVINSRRAAGEVLRQLREQDPPVVGRIEKDRVLLDPRTVLPDEDDGLIAAVVRALQ